MNPLPNYNIRLTFVLPVLGGFSVNHIREVPKSDKWGVKFYHIVAALIEAMPIIGHIISIAERSFFNNVYSPSNLSNSDSLRGRASSSVSNGPDPIPVSLVPRLSSFVPSEPLSQ